MTTDGDGNAAVALTRVRDVASTRDEPTASGRGDVAVASLPTRLARRLVATLGSWRGALVAPFAGAGERAAGLSPWAAPPPSLAELHRYVADGEWVPGDRAPILEFLGRAFGFLVVLPVHAVAYGALWVLARPTRLGIAAVLGFALWVVA